jgi:hypothetical protein
MKLFAYLFAIFSVLLLIAASTRAAPVEENMMDMESELSLDDLNLVCKTRGSTITTGGLTVNCDE